MEKFHVKNQEFISKMTGKNEKFLEEIDFREKIIMKLMEKYQEKDNKLKEIRQKMIQLECRDDDFKSEIKNKELEISDLRAKNSSLEETICNLQQSLGEMSENLKVLQKENNSKNLIINQLNFNNNFLSKKELKNDLAYISIVFNLDEGKRIT